MGPTHMGSWRKWHFTHSKPMFVFMRMLVLPILRCICFDFSNILADEEHLLEAVKRKHKLPSAENRISDEDCLLGLDPKNDRPNWKILHALPIQPPPIGTFVMVDTSFASEASLLESNMLTEMAIRGVPSLNKVLKNNSYKVNRHRLDHNQDFKAISEWMLVVFNEDVEPKRTTSNHLIKIIEVLGFEAVRIFHELRVVISLDASYVNYWQLAILRNTMTIQGHLMAITYHGINLNCIGMTSPSSNLQPSPFMGSTFSSRVDQMTIQPRYPALTPTPVTHSQTSPTHSPSYSPSSPPYSPTSPSYRLTSPFYSPTSPHYIPTNHFYNPNSPIYIPTSPFYSVASVQI